MRAVVMRETGGPEVLGLEEVPTPAPGAGEVLIRVSLAGVNFADTGMRRGMVHGPGEDGLPATPGFEVVGTVAALGADVAEPPEGTRVAAVLPAGGYAEYTVAPAEAVVPVPEGVDDLSATALLVQGLTAYGVLHDAARLESGEAVLVQAAGGGVGSLAVQLARLAGAETVIGTAGSAGKLALVDSLGADRAVDYSREGWTGEVLGATGGRGVDVVLEAVGGEIGGAAYDVLAPLGRLVTYGAASGEGLRPPDMWQLNLKGQTVGGCGGPWIRPGAAEKAREAVSDHLRSGGLKVVEGPSFPLAEAAEAHRALEGRASTGKVALTVRDH